LKSHIQIQPLSREQYINLEDIMPEARRIFSESLNKKIIISLDQLKCRIQDLFELVFTDKADSYLSSWYKNIVRFKFLEDYLIDESVTEISIRNDSVFLYKQSWENIPNNIVRSVDIQLALEVLSHLNSAHWNASSPYASFFAVLDNYQFRATLIHKSISPKSKSSLYLRRISKSIFTLEDFKISSEAQNIIQRSIETKKNVLFVGATGSGKTSLLKTCLSKISESEHIVTLEDTHEISLNNQNVSSLIAQDEKRKSLKDLCSYSLRMQPDRLILGEIRSDEVVPLIMSLNTGHKGVMSTIHANSARDSLHRVSLLFQLFSQVPGIEYNTIMNLVCKAIDIVVFLKDKEVKEIIEVKSAEAGVPYFENLL